MTKAISYLRTSSATNVGVDKDSDKRQRAAIEAFAAANGYEIEEEFYDAAVKGTDAVTERPGFSALLDYAAEHDVHVILVESPDRFARDTIVALTGHAMLQKQGFELIPTTAPDYFVDDGSNSTAKLIRTILIALADWEKDVLVKKLRAARDRKRAATGRCEGRPPAPEATRQLAHRLNAYGYMSLRGISTALAQSGHMSPSGRPYSASSIKAMLR